MHEEAAYNPLDKRNLGISVADALLTRPPMGLPPPAPFLGAGIYALYYNGDYPAYAPLAERNQLIPGSLPIYVGKAVPEGARKGGFGLGLAPGTVLFTRLNEHAMSITQAQNLDLSHFTCRYLVVDDIWIPLGEALLIEMFMPLWNRVLDGFGNHDPGSGRSNQKRSAWDVLHPGRPWATRLQPHGRTDTTLLALIHRTLAPLNTPPSPPTF